MAEYLWQFSAFSNPGAAVLAGEQTADANGGRRYTLLLARRIPADSAQNCDVIERLNWHYDLAPDGAVTRRLESVRRFSARLDGATPQVCTGT